MSRGFAKTIGRRIRIRQCDDASASCSGSSQLDPPSASSACTVQFTTPSIFNATSSSDPPAALPRRSDCRVARSGRSGMTYGEPWLSMRARYSCRDNAETVVHGTPTAFSLHRAINRAAITSPALRRLTARSQETLSLFVLDPVLAADQRAPTRRGSRALFFRHPGLALAGEKGGLDQGADFRHPVRYGGLQVGDARITTIGGEPPRFGEFRSGAFGLAFESIGGR